MRRLLLVDDDRSLASILATALEEEGYSVATAADGLAGLRSFEAAPPDLVILDVLMPEMDGLEVCRRIRRSSTVPIILLTSRAEDVDKVTGLESGADDYVTKPFSTRELVARIRAIARRVEPAPAAATAPAPSGLPPEPLAAGALALDPSRFEVRWGDSPVALTRSEFLVLSALVKHRGIVLGRERLLDLVRGGEVVVTDRTIDTFIKRIRKKLKEADPAFDEIETVIGVGYRYRTGP
ncbi:MAG: response regulator transcription factor [Myxococcaceae bacterium]